MALFHPRLSGRSSFMRVAFLGAAILVAVCRTPAQNLLANPSFEADGAALVNPPAGWTAWTEQGSLRGTLGAASFPEMPFAMLDYSYAAGAATDRAAFRGGYYQQLAVEPGHRYHCTVYLHTPSGGGTPGSGRLGVDPGGGTNPGVPAVRWTDWTTYAAGWDRIGFTFEDAVVAIGPTATVFLALRRAEAVAWNAVLFDYAAFYDVTPVELPAEHLWGWVAPGGRWGDDRGPAEAVKLANELWYDTLEGGGVRGSWAECEPAPGVWDWSSVEASGPQKAPLVDKGSVLLSGLWFGSTSWSPPFDTPLYWFYAERFVTEQARQANRWGTVGWVFENEPEAKDDISGHGHRLKHAYCALKLAGRHNLVIAPNISGTNTGQYDNLYTNYSLKYSTDVIGSHQYSGNPDHGVAVGGVDGLHIYMVGRGDGDKKIWLGEGWAPYAALGDVFRPNHNVWYDAREVEAIRRTVTNGYRNMTTGEFFPGHRAEWLWGASFFTMNDWYNKYGWRARAVPVDEDHDGRVDYYTVDGYRVGLDIDPGYNPTGLADFRGNSKDDILDVFPGANLSLANPGFELEWELDDPYAWETDGPAGACMVDRSVRRHGRQSLRFQCDDFATASARQRSVRHSLAGGRPFAAAAWCRTWGVSPNSGRGAALGLRFVDVMGEPLGSESWSDSAPWTGGWTRLAVTAVAPEGANMLEVALVLDGASGRVWFDDVSVNEGTEVRPATIRGVVVDDRYEPLPGATVVVGHGEYSAMTDAAGEYLIEGVVPSTYDLRAAKAGHADEAALAQIAPASRTRVTSFVLPALEERRPTDVKAFDRKTGTTLDLEWRNPTGPHYQYLRIYGAEIPSQPGVLLADQVTGEAYTLTGLQSGERRYISLEAVHADIGAALRTEVVLGKPSYGKEEVFYQVGGQASWGGYYTNDWGQTFTADKTYDLAYVSCMIGTGGTGSREMRVSIHEGGRGGPQLGPTRVQTMPSDETHRFWWGQGEVPLREGQTYYVKFYANNGGFGMYRNPNNAYRSGEAYARGELLTYLDVWSTMAGVFPPDVVIRDVSAEWLGGGQARVTWQTELPSTSRVQWGPTAAYGTAVDGPGTPLKGHAVLLTGLTPGLTLHYRVMSTWNDTSTETSPDYLLYTGEAPDTPTPCPSYTPTPTLTPTQTPIPGSNLLINPGAEHGDMSGWVVEGIPAGQPMVDPPEVVPDPANHSGAHRFGVAMGGGAGWAIQRQTVHVYPGRTYEAGMWIAKQPGATEVLIASWVDGGPDGAARQLFMVPPQFVLAEWTSYVGYRFVPATDVVTLMLEYGHLDDGPVAAIHVDDLYLREVLGDTPPPTDTPTPTRTPGTGGGTGILSLF